MLTGTVARAQDISFLARRDFATGVGPISAVIGDFNGDRKLDLAVASVNKISVLINNTSAR